MKLKDLDTLQIGDLLHYAYMPDNRLFGPVSRVYRVASVQNNATPTGVGVELVELKRMPSGHHFAVTGGAIWANSYDGTLEQILPNLSKLDASIANRMNVGV